MLLYQNACATEGTLAGYFSSEPAIGLQLNELAEANRQIGLRLLNQKVLPANDVKRLLEINKVVRQLYDTTASRFIESFDNAHKPMMGWEWHLSRDD